jgi:NitT/TauT family transport system substrate-binding protein
MKKCNPLLIVIFSLFLAACVLIESPPVDAVSVQLKWVHQAQFAGIYIAQDKGYYAEENLDVTILEGGPGINSIQSLFQGNADFTIDSAINCLLSRDQGEPVVAIAAIYRHNPTVFGTMPDSGIEHPADFIGKKVAIAGGSDFEIQLQAIANKLGLDMDQIDIVPHSYDITPLYSGEIDVLGIYAIGGLIRAQQAGYDLDVIWPSDYGVHSYADVLISTDAFLENNPEVTTRFLRATLRGWRDAIEDPEGAVDNILSYALEADSDTQLRMISASVPLVHTGQDQIGWMRSEVWQGMHNILLEQGILKAPMDIEKIFTLDFLEAIYENSP